MGCCHAPRACGGLLIVLVLTNGTHFQVFSFDICARLANSYAYNWGYRLAVVICAAGYLAFFGFLFAASRRRLHGVIGLLIIADGIFLPHTILYALRRGCVPTNFSLNYCLVVVALLELALDFGLPSYGITRPSRPSAA